MSNRRETSARSRYLGAELRARRETANLTALHLANRLGWAASTISRIENGERGATPTNLATYLTLCDVLGADQAGLLELARAREDERWSVPHGDRMPDEARALRYQQEQANRITCYHPGAIPELLQTEEIATLQVRHQAGAAAILPDLLAGQVAARIDRQNILHEAGRSWVFYLDETTLRTLPGDPNIRSGQVAALAMLIGSGHIRVRVIPTHLAQAGVAVGRFWLFGFQDYAPVVCIQTDTISLFAEKEPDLVAYERILGRLDAIALSEHASTELIVRLTDHQSGERAADRVPEQVS